MSASFRMNFSYEPKNEKPLIKIGDSVICSAGNVTLIIAKPGIGKSSVCDSICAGALNPDCDSLGFIVDAKNVLSIDTERVWNDLFKGLRNIKRRTGLSEEEIMEHLNMRSFVSIDSIDTAKKEFESLLARGNYELVVIDGSADFLKSVNDEEESKSFWRWLIGLANKYGFGVVATIHPNPADENGKATGHLGSQGQKKAESVLNIVYAAESKDIRLITSDSQHGKVRNAMDKITTSFTWSKEAGMFVSCDAPERKAKVTVRRQILEKVFAIKDAYTYNELCLELEKATGKSLSTAKRLIKEAKEIEEIYVNSGLYWLEKGNEELTINNEEFEEEEKEEATPF